MNKLFFTERSLKVAAGQVRKAILSSLPEPEECEHEFSEEYSARVSDLCAASQSRERKPKMHRGIIAAVLAVVVGVFILFMMNPEANAATMEWIRHFFGNKVTYWYAGENENTLPTFELTWVPEGYACVYEERLTYFHVMLYQRGDDETDSFTVDCSVAQDDSPITVDMFDTEYTLCEVNINGCVGEAYISNVSTECNILIWFDNANNVVFTMMAYFDLEVMLHIAESIELAN